MKDIIRRRIKEREKAAEKARREEAIQAKKTKKGTDKAAAATLGRGKTTKAPPPKKLPSAV